LSGCVSAQRARLLVYSPDMAANGAANKPVADANLLGKWQPTSLDILTLRARKSTDGDVVSHVDEKVGTHDGQPFFRLVRAARQGTPRTKDRAGSCQKRYATVLQRTTRNHRKPTEPMSSYYSTPKENADGSEIQASRRSNGQQLTIRSAGMLASLA
jgi:hypothetical protein